VCSVLPLVLVLVRRLWDQVNREYEAIEQLITKALYVMRHSEENELRCLLVQARARARQIYSERRLEHAVPDL